MFGSKGLGSGFTYLEGIGIMRVNVYGEELTDRVTLVEKTVDEGGKIYTFYGIRFWLKFPNQDWWLHRKVDGHIDDDSTAITIWHRDKEALERMFQRALSVLAGTYAEYGITAIEDETTYTAIKRMGQNFANSLRKAMNG